MASLIKAVYTLAPVEKVSNFELKETLKDEKDSSIYGALYEYKGESHPNNPPLYVIAFRGTKFIGKTWVEDIKLNAKCIANTPQNRSRFKHATNYVREMVRARGANVWLAGHSLGAAIALHAGKQMFREGRPLVTYLFNPPFCSDFVARFISDERKSLVGYFAKSVIKEVLSHFGKESRRRAAEAYKDFVALSNWVPFLFVNPDDPVSSEYIHYFENRQTMLKIRLEELAIKASSMTMRMAIGIDSSSEAIHFIPSAILITNNKVGSHQGNSDYIKKKIGHELQQWLNPDSYCQTKDYRYSTTN